MTTARQQQFLANDVASLETMLAELIAAYPELEEDDELRADMLEGETDLHRLLSRLVNNERDADALAKAVAGRISDLQARKARAEKRKEVMRVLMLRIMKATGLPRLALPEATVSIGKKAAGVEIVDEEALPENVVRITRAPDKKAIADLLKAGEAVPGAKMGEPGETLSLRVA